MIFRLMLCVLFIVASANAQLTPVYKHDNEQQGGDELKTPRQIDGGNKRFFTETVYGFLDFTTTVGSTVMVFTPQSEVASFDESSITVAMTSLNPVTIATAIVEQHLPTEKSRSKTYNAPTGLAKLLQEALLLKHSKSTKKKIEKRPIIYAPVVTQKVIQKKAPRLEPSIYVPEEVVVSAGQQLPSISVLGPFNTDIDNDLSNNLRYDFAISEPRPSANVKYALVNIESEKKTGLVTTLGGTIISNGQTIIHKTSVIGTYIGDQYAQILRSTSMIFNLNPASMALVSPTPRPKYETVSTVTKGSRTQFINQIQSSVIPDRKPRYELSQQDRDASLIKRRGSHYNERDYYYYADDNLRDQYYDEYDELSRADTGPRPSFKPINVYQPTIQPTKTFQRPLPSSTFRHRYKSGSTRNTPPSFLRNSPPPLNFNRDRDRDRFRLSANRFSNKPPTTSNNNNKSIDRKQSRRPPLKNRIATQVKQPSKQVTSVFKPNQKVEETVRVATSKPTNGPTNVWYEIITLKTLHTYRLGAKQNTRYRTYTRINTHTIVPTATSQFIASNPTIYENPPLFENILDKPREITTLPPITINDEDLETFLKKTTETIMNVETMYKTSVLPVYRKTQLQYHTLIQTYYITRMITAVKTIPPYQNFNEYNGPLAVGETEDILSLQPRERERDENGALREKLPINFEGTDQTLKELAGAKFNPEALEKSVHPQPVVNDESPSQYPQLLPGTNLHTQNVSPIVATPPLSPEALQMYYFRLMMGGGLPTAAKPKVITSSILISTNIMTTETNVLIVTLNARKIHTTISSTFLKSTVLTSYYETTVTPSAGLSPFGGFPFSPFAAPVHGR